MLFNGEVAIVTGSVQGIGLAIAEEFLKKVQESLFLILMMKKEKLLKLHYQKIAREQNISIATFPKCQKLMLQ